jgi:hypothetical protein
MSQQAKIQMVAFPLKEQVMIERDTASRAAKGGSVARLDSVNTACSIDTQHSVS